MSRPVVDGAGDGAVDRLQELVSAVLEENEQLKRALGSRIVIEQAKGVLAERFGLTMQESFQVLRSAARNNRMSIHTLAESVVASRETPPQIRPPRAA
ncbi:MAG TPA: ANTAR domain-containing protein [Gaiellaceae bacterium]